MGFFRKKHNTEYDDNFILDFSASPENREEPKASDEKKSDINDLNITLWDERKPSRAPHAMTVNEILGDLNDNEDAAKNPESRSLDPENLPEYTDTVAENQDKNAAVNTAKNAEIPEKENKFEQIAMKSQKAKRSPEVRKSLESALPESVIFDDLAEKSKAMDSAEKDIPERNQKYDTDTAAEPHTDKLEKSQKPLPEPVEKVISKDPEIAAEIMPEQNREPEISHSIEKPVMPEASLQPENEPQKPEQEIKAENISDKIPEQKPKEVAKKADILEKTSEKAIKTASQTAANAADIKEAAKQKTDSPILKDIHSESNNPAVEEPKKVETPEEELEAYGKASEDSLEALKKSFLKINHHAEDSHLFTKSEPVSRGAVIETPKDEAPKFADNAFHAEVDYVDKQLSDEELALEKQKELQEAGARTAAMEQAEKLIDEMKEKFIKKYNVNLLEDLQEPEETAAPKQEQTHESTAKKDGSLSPTAQILYDRMMAERAKQQSVKATENEPKATENEPKATESQAKANEKAVVTEEPVAEKAEISLLPDENENPENNTIAEENAANTIETEADKSNAKGSNTKNTEHIADEIFNFLNESMNDDNPLIKEKNRSANSLLGKCKSFINPKYDADYPSGSIDDIIKDAEKGARERLSNFYDVQNDEPPKSDDSFSTHDFAAFSTHTLETPESGAKQITVPVKIEDESPDRAVISSSTGDIKNFQYSFADNPATAPDTVEIGATRVIDISSSAKGHVTDPIKAQTIKMHLEKIAEEEPEEKTETAKLKFSGSDEAEIPETDVSDYSDNAPVLDDYKNFSDAETIRTDLASQKVSLTARIITTAAITFILGIMDFAFGSLIIQSSALVYSAVNIVLLILALGINYNTLKGFAGILSGAPDMDSPASLAAVCTLLYTVISVASGSVSTMPALAPIGVMTLLFNLIGKQYALKRIRRGFEVIATDENKKAVIFVEDKLSASVMANGSVIGEALICEGKETRNITDYLKNSYSEDPYEKRLTPLLIFTLIAAAVLSLVAFFVVGGFSSALVAFTLVTFAACPPSSLLVCNLPFCLASKKLSEYGAMISGHAAVDSIANANAVAFDCKDLFPAGTIKLYNMQVLNKGAVDKYIAAAAAVLTAANSPLSPIFEEIIATNKQEKMPIADSIKYENNMGVSGWIEDHRVFVGNRTLMEGHSIKTPSLELDKKILREGYFPVYLAFDQQLCALFIVGYEADEEITYELRRLYSTGVTMLVNSNDPNVSDNMLCDYFGLYPDSIKVMNQTGVSAYKSISQFKQSVSAPASYSNGVSGFLATVTSAIKLKSIIDILMVLQIVMIALGIGLTGYFIFSGALLSLPVLLLGGFQLATAALTAAVAYFKQP